MYVRTETFKEFRILTKLSYKMGYRFYNGKKYNPLLMWLGWYGLAPVRGLWYQDFENSKRIKFCDFKSWLFVDYIEFGEFMLWLKGDI